jgi:hypothetical protein
MPLSICQLNIEHFRKLLTRTDEEAKRRQILKLLAEEEEKAKRFGESLSSTERVASLQGSADGAT